MQTASTVFLRIPGRRTAADRSPHSDCDATLHARTAFDRRISEISSYGSIIQRPERDSRGPTNGQSTAFCLCVRLSLSLSLFGSAVRMATHARPYTLITTTRGWSAGGGTQRRVLRVRSICLCVCQQRQVDLTSSRPFTDLAGRRVAARHSRRQR